MNSLCTLGGKSECCPLGFAVTLSRAAQVGLLHIPKKDSTSGKVECDNSDYEGARRRLSHDLRESPAVLGCELFREHVGIVADVDRVDLRVLEVSRFDFLQRLLPVLT